MPHPRDFDSDSIEMINFFHGFFLAYSDELKDYGDIDFDGEGSYFGKQISIREGSGFGSFIKDEEVEIEIAYDFISKHIVIYTDNHNGYYAPPFVEIKGTHSEYDKLSKALYRMLSKYFGLLDLGA